MNQGLTRMLNNSLRVRLQMSHDLTWCDYPLTLTSTHLQSLTNIDGAPPVEDMQRFNACGAAAAEERGGPVSVAFTAQLHHSNACHACSQDQACK